MGVTDPISNGDTAGTEDAIIAGYQGLTARVRDNFDLQWRGPTFALTAQSFMFVAFVNSSNRSVDLVFGIVILAVGVVATLVMSRMRYRIQCDQLLLDRYEEAFLPGPLRQLHTRDLKGRTESVARDLPLCESPKEMSEFVDSLRAGSRRFTGFSPEIMWSLLLLMIGLLGLALGVAAASGVKIH